MADGFIPEHFAEDPFLQDVIPSSREPTHRKSTSRTRQRQTADAEPVQPVAIPPAPPSPAFKSFCGQVGRLLGRVTAECAEGTEDYQRVTSWFCKWLNQQGVVFRFVKRPEDEFVQAPHYTAFCRRASDGARSAFYLYEETGDEFVRLSRLPKNKRTYTATCLSISDESAQAWADGIQRFLNASTETNTFNRFLEEISK